MPIERVDLTAFSPDLRPDQPSIIVDSDQMFPTTRGLRTLPYPIESGPSLPGGWCYGAFEARYLDETRRRFGGDNDSIQELVNGIWVDRTGGGQTYTMPSRGRWRWVQFGDVTLATNGSATDPLQGFHADSPGDGFLPVGRAPAAREVHHGSAELRVPREPFARKWKRTAGGLRVMVDKRDC